MTQRSIHTLDKKFKIKVMPGVDASLHNQMSQFSKKNQLRKRTRIFLTELPKSNKNHC